MPARLQAGMMWIFKSAGKANLNNKDYQFWQQDNRPIQLSTSEMAEQRLEYIHQNPIHERLVAEAHHYIYSSALDYSEGRGCWRLSFSKEAASFFSLLALS